MIKEELEYVMRKLREFAVAQGMQWVLDEVDEAIALGFSETRTLRQTNRGGVTEYEEVPSMDLELPSGRRGRRRRRGEEFTRSRPMTLNEQTELLLRAIGKVLIDLDEVANGAMKTLDPASLQDYLDEAATVDALNSPVLPIDSIAFIPDEGSTAPEVSIDVLRNSYRRARVSELLSRIGVEIHS